MKQEIHTIEIETSGQGLYDLSAPVITWVRAQSVRTGLLTLWCRHTSASLLVQENADPDVRADRVDFLRKIVPEGGFYRHHQEGPDDMPAHIKAALTQTCLSVPVQRGAPMLGTWQRLYLFEHRAQPQNRQVTLHILGS